MIKSLSKTLLGLRAIIKEEEEGIYSQRDLNRILLGVPVFFGKGKISKGTYPTLFIPLWIGIVLMPTRIRILSQVSHVLEIHRNLFTFNHRIASFSFVASVVLIIIFNIVVSKLILFSRKIAV